MRQQQDVERALRRVVGWLQHGLVRRGWYGWASAVRWGQQQEMARLHAEQLLAQQERAEEASARQRAAHAEAMAKLRSELGGAGDAQRKKMEKDHKAAMDKALAALRAKMVKEGEAAVRKAEAACKAQAKEALAKKLKEQEA